MNSGRGAINISGMNMLILSALGVLLAATLVVVLAARARRVRIRNRQIAESLDAIRVAADKSRIKGIAVPEIDISPAFQKLTELAADCPKEVLATLQEMEDRWREVSRRVAEYNAQDTVSTLQSSLALSKTDALVGEIHELARQIKVQLGVEEP